jgi:hypothetical protein
VDVKILVLAKFKQMPRSGPSVSKRVRKKECVDLCNAGLRVLTIAKDGGERVTVVVSSLVGREVILGAGFRGQGKQNWAQGAPLRKIFMS